MNNFFEVKHKISFNEIYNSLKSYGVNKYSFYIVVIIFASFSQKNHIIKKLSTYVDRYQYILVQFKKDDFFNVGIYILTILASLYFLYRRLKNRYTSLNSFMLALSLFVFLIILEDKYYFYPIDWSFNYLYLAISIMGMYLIIYFYRYVLQQKLIYFNKVKNIEVNEKNVGWDIYIDLLIDFLLKKDFVNEYFSLGIIGDWGSGKTTFLEKMDKKLHEKAFVVKFNPWNSHSEQQIVSDFFNTLQSTLSLYYSNINKPLKQYSNLLNNIHPNINQITDFFLNETNSLTNLKLEVENCLLNFEKPIIVIIDDIDRLNSNEIGEVFKLIRNSAKFRNIIYITAYDKSYVTSALRQKGIEDPKNFIEKLFNLEIVLPSFEPNVLPELLLELIMKSSLSKYQMYVNDIKEIIRKKQLKSSHFILNDYLKTFRSVERFATQFTHNFEVLTKTDLAHQISISDFFWLELLLYLDLDTYNQLSRNHIKILNKENNCFVYSNEQVNIGSDIGGNILKILFSKAQKDWNSVKYEEFFHRYFSYRLLNDQISVNAFKTKLNKSTDEFISYLENNIMNKKEISLFNVFNIFTFKKSSNEMYLRFLKGALTFYLLSSQREVEVELIIKSLLNKNSLPTNANNEDLKKESLVIFKERISMKIFIVKMNYLLTFLFGGISFNPEGFDLQYRSSNLLLSNDDLEKLSCENFQYFIEQNENNFISIFKRKTIENQFFNNCIKRSDYSYGPYSGEEFEIDYYLLPKKVFIEYITKLEKVKFRYLINSGFSYLDSDIIDNYDSYEESVNRKYIDKIHRRIYICFGTFYKFIHIVVVSNAYIEDELFQFFDKINLQEEYLDYKKKV